MSTKAQQAALGEAPHWTVSNACRSQNHMVCPGTFMNYHAPGHEPLTEDKRDISGSDPTFFRDVCKCLLCRHGRDVQ